MGENEGDDFVFEGGGAVGKCWIEGRGELEGEGGATIGVGADTRKDGERG